MVNQNRVWGVVMAKKTWGCGPQFVAGYVTDTEAIKKATALKKTDPELTVWVGLTRTYYFADGKNHMMSKNDMAGEIILGGEKIN